jgi:hypothetical protein
MPVPDFSPGEVLTAAAMDSIGLWLVTSTTTTGATQEFNNVFTSKYKNYKIVVTSSLNSTSVDITARMRVGGVDNLATDYTTGGYRADWANSGAVAALYNTNQSYFYMGRLDASSNIGLITMEIFNPQNAQETTFVSQFMDGRFLGNRIGRLNNAVQYDGLTIFLSSTWAGTISIYGMRD